MKVLEIRSMLEVLRDARIAWGKGRTEFYAGYDVVLKRLLFEAAANFMSPQDVASALAVSPKTVRARMRELGLDGRGKTLLSQKASEALLINAELMGIEPSEMDLTSPLAYLPMGEQMKKELRDRTVSQVYEVEDETVSGNLAPLTDEEFAAIEGCVYENGYDTEKAEALWPGFTKPGGDVLRLAIDALLRSRA